MLPSCIICCWLTLTTLESVLSKSVEAPSTTILITSFLFGTVPNCTSVLSVVSTTSVLSINPASNCSPFTVT